MYFLSLQIWGWGMLERVERVYNPSTEETEAGRTGTQGYSMTQTKYEASLLCMRPCLKKSKENRTKRNSGKKKKNLKDTKHLFMGTWVFWWFPIPRHSSNQAEYSWRIENATFLMTEPLSQAHAATANRNCLIKCYIVYHQEETVCTDQGFYGKT